MTKTKKGARIKDIIRLFFKYDIEAIPVIDNKNVFKGLIFKQELIDSAGEIFFIEKTFSSVIDRFISFPEEPEFLQFISKLNDNLEFPAINLKGEMLHLWKKKNLLNVYYNISKNIIREKTSDETIDFEHIINILPFNFIIINLKNKIIFATNAFLKNLDFKKEILINQAVHKIFPKINIIRTKDSYYPKMHKIKYQHQDWYYTIFNLGSESSMKGYYLYLFSQNKDINFDTVQPLIAGKEAVKEKLKEERPLNELIELQEKELIKKVLEESDWNISEAARILKTPRQTLQYKISKYKIG